MIVMMTTLEISKLQMNTTSKAITVVEVRMRHPLLSKITFQNQKICQDAMDSEDTLAASYLVKREK